MYDLEQKKVPSPLVNILMVWVTCATALLLFIPWDRISPEIAERVSIYHNYLVTAFFVEITNFIARFLMNLWTSVSQRKQRETNERIIRTQIATMDYAERALIREYVLQRKSALNLPVNQPAVTGLKHRGILFQQSQTDEDGKALFSVSRLAKPFISYKILGLSTGKMSPEQWEQIMLERPQYARPAPKIQHVYRSGAFKAA